MTGKQWEFTVLGPPVAKERPRYNRQTNTWYTPTRTKNFEANVAMSALAAHVILSPDRKCRVEIDFYLSAYRGDNENLQKSVLDGMNQTGDWDDRQVVDIHARIKPVKDASEERTVVRVVEL